MNSNFYSHIILGNTNELFLEEVFLLPTKQISQLLDDYAYAANRSIYYESDNKIIILPKIFDERLREHYIKHIGYQNVVHWYPNKQEDSLCLAILKDEQLFAKLQEVIAAHPKIVLTAYAYTKEFDLLVKTLREKGLEFSLDNEPTTLDIVRELNSKTAFRLLMETVESQIGEQIIPKGKICDTVDQAVALMEDFIEKTQPFVIKSNNGASGRGVILSENIPTQKTLDYFYARLKADKMWEQSQIVVEEKIIAPVVFSPASELIITDTDIVYTYWYIQTLTDKGECFGALIGQEYASQKVQESLQHQSLLIAKAYQQKGYRGFLGIDFIVDAQENVYAIETNARRTGVTHGYDILKFIYGKQWVNQHTYVCNYWEFQKNIQDLQTLLNILKPLIYDGKKGIIILNFSSDLNELSFLIVACNKQEIDIYVEQLSTLI